MALVIMVLVITTGLLVGERQRQLGTDDLADWSDREGRRERQRDSEIQTKHERRRGAKSGRQGI